MNKNNQEQPKKKPKQKPTKPKGYSEDSDLLWYTSTQDEREAAEVTNFRFTQINEDFNDRYF